VSSRCRVEQVEPPRRGRGAQFDQYRLQQQLGGQRVRRHAAQHQRHGHHTGEVAGADLVEEELEQAGVGGLVGRAGDDGDLGRT
jgi:hypothetical protein